MTDWTEPTGFSSRIRVTNNLGRTIVVGLDTIIPLGETRPLPWFYDPLGCVIPYEFIDGDGEQAREEK